MEKQAPSVTRILIAVGFALSCFCILLFLWLSFGGPVPLSAQSYRISADFSEAVTLPVEADVRIGGVTVGSVKSLELAPRSETETGPEATRAEIEIEPEFAPISADARAILRQKTLLGETYVELTSGSEPGEPQAPVSLGVAASVSDAEAAPPSVPDGGHLADTQVEEATQIDEIFNALDEETRRSFQAWQKNAALAVDQRGLDMNDALGNLDPFVFDSTELLEVLDAERPYVRGLVRDTGQVFAALSDHERDLGTLIADSESAFEAVASEDVALGEAFTILPTFEREARATLERLEGFRSGAEPLVDALLPASVDVAPTLRSVSKLSPSLRDLFVDLDPLYDAADPGLPALTATLDELAPALQSLDPFLANLNPVVRTLSLYRHSVTDFLAGPPSGIADTLPIQPGQPAPRHIVRQFSYISPEALALYPQRLATNRGNGYMQPLSLTNSTTASRGIAASLDCRNTDYTPTSADPDEGEVGYGSAPADVNNGQPANSVFAPCVIAPDWSEFGLGSGRAPVTTPDD